MKKILFFFVFVNLFMSCSSDSEEELNLPPSKFEIAVSGVTDTTAELNWEEAIDPEKSIVYYQVSLNEKVLESELSVTSLSLVDLEEKTKYTVKITATDKEGESTVSSMTFTTVLNGEPSGFTVEVSEIKETSAQLNWGASKDPEGKAVIYSVTLNGEMVAENLKETSLSLSDLTNKTEYKVVIIATDVDSKSTKSEKTFTTLETNLAPNKFEVTIGDITNNSAKVLWTESIDPNGDVVTYDVYLNESVVASGLETLNYVLEGLESTTSYVVKVVSKDLKLTTEVEKTFETTSNPPAGFNIEIDNISDSGALVNWDDAVDPDGDNVFYDLYINGEEIATGWTNSIYGLTSLTPNTEYVVKVVARDTSGAATINTVTFKTKPVDGSFTVLNVDIYKDQYVGYLVVLKLTDSFVVSSVTIDNTTFDGFFAAAPDVLNFGITEEQYNEFLTSAENKGSLKYSSGGKELDYEFTYNVK
ncbi:fibronectin type III domain-containing protein [Tenacibaculum sp. Ill]|uniref:fibronectin type III domain-containing protein n=1 Tax=Tenacibaculum sp. Ill TaxID=3445935 RepID=UPI003F78DD80